MSESSKGHDPNDDSSPASVPASASSSFASLNEMNSLCLERAIGDESVLIHLGMDENGNNKHNSDDNNDDGSDIRDVNESFSHISLQVNSEEERNSNNNNKLTNVGNHDIALFMEMKNKARRDWLNFVEFFTCDMETALTKYMSSPLSNPYNNALAFNESDFGKLYMYSKFGQAFSFDDTINKILRDQLQIKGSDIKTKTDVIHAVSEMNHTSCLFAACEAGHIAVVKKIIEIYSENNNDKNFEMGAKGCGLTINELKNGNKFGVSCLSICAQRGRSSILRLLLLSSNFALDEIQPLLQNALVEAAKNNHLCCFKLLLAFGTPYHAYVDFYGRNIFEIVKVSKCFKISKYMESRMDYTPLMHACELCDLDLVLRLVKSGPSSSPGNRSECGTRENNIAISQLKFSKEEKAKFIKILQSSEEKKLNLGNYRSIIDLLENYTLNE